MDKITQCAECGVYHFGKYADYPNKFLCCVCINEKNVCKCVRCKTGLRHGEHSDNLCRACSDILNRDKALKQLEILRKDYQKVDSSEVRKFIDRLIEEYETLSMVML